MQPLLLGVVFVLCCCSPEPTEAARILALFPHLGKSHYIFFEPLMKTLAARGHEFVVITPFPQKKPIPRCKEIDVSPALPRAYVNSLPFGDFGKEDVFPTMELLISLADFTCDKVLSYPPVQKLIHSQDERFDLIMHEPFNTDCFLGFAHKFQAPLFAIFSAAIMPWTNDRFGNPDNPAYIPSLLLSHSDKMSFLQRLKNAIYYVGIKLYYKLYFDIPDNKVAKKYFGEDLPPLEDIAANTSLLLLNTHFSFVQARPFVPAIVEVAGLHIEPPTKLPQDIEQFLNESKHGVIYFSLGSTLRTSGMPKQMLEALLAAFSELPQRVLWKWEDDIMPGKPHNVKTVKWMPQMAVLAHPNVKVFLNHGGLMGTIEAVYNAVPMVSIPMFGDQYHNVEMCMSKGISVKLPYREITKEGVLKAVKKVLDDPQYRENARRVSRAYHDRPQSPLDTAVYWTEYVIKHRGAPHLKSAAVDLNIAQYLLLDVCAVLITVALLLVCVLYLTMRFVLRRIFGYKNHSTKASKKKKSQ